MTNKYEAIINHIQQSISVGKIKPGQKLPSIREIADLFACNKATAIHAYNKLEQEHLIYAVPKSGYFLVEQEITPQQPQPKQTYNFATGVPHADVLPYLDLQHCFNQAVDKYKQDLFSYLPPQGLPSLITVLTDYLQDAQVFVKPEHLSVTTGVQQALYLLATLPFPNGKTNILVEQPTYLGILDACTRQNVTVIGIKRDFKGINFEELERIFSTGNIKFFFTMPRFHNPLGTSYTMAQKKQLLELANRYDVYLVEDDYLADLELDTKADPLYTLDLTRSRVIYLRSFSKTLIPGLRLGVVVLPELLVTVFKERKKAADLTTSVLSQGSLEIYINSGMITKHNKLIKQLYREKMTALQDACQRHLPAGVGFQIPPTGIYTCLQIPCHAQSLKETLAQQRVLIKNTGIMCLPYFNRNDQIRLSICKVTSEEIHQGLAIIGTTIRQLTHTPTLSPADDLEL
ncbi:MAG TPA: PLP-dependent aminotransferase family protein [Bacillota bacterium]|nr:PLP-dependent aminotransferase family protein [Bacillota bacterium]